MPLRTSRAFAWATLKGDVINKAEKIIGTRDIKVTAGANGSLLRTMTVGPPDAGVAVKETISIDEAKQTVKYDAVDDPLKAGYVHTWIHEHNGHVLLTGEFCWTFNATAPAEVITGSRAMFPALTSGSMTGIVKYTEEAWAASQPPCKNYVIERDLPGAGNMTQEQLKGICSKSCSVLCEMPGLQWVQSYVAQDKIFCIYRSRDEESIKAHAAKGGFPCTKISVVKAIIDPTY